MKEIKFGIIGTGAIFSLSHANAIDKISNAKIIKETENHEMEQEEIEKRLWYNLKEWNLRKQKVIFNINRIHQWIRLAGK